MRYSLGTVLVGLVLVFAATTTARGAVQAPALTSGDRWTYRTNSSFGEGFYFEGEATLSMISRGPVTIEGATLDAYRLSVSGEGSATGTFTTRFGSAPASGTWVLTGEETIEASGHKVISRVVDLEANGTLHTQPLPLQFQLSVQNTTTFHLLEDDWIFPFEIGQSAVVHSRMNFSEDFRLFYGFPTTPVRTTGSAWWNVTYALEAQVVLDTPAGHFEAYRMRQSYPDGSHSVLFFAPAAGNDVRTETYSVTGQIAAAELISYRFQALEAASFLGLTALEWTLIAVGSVAAVAAVLFLRRRRRTPAEPPGPPPRLIT